MDQVSRVFFVRSSGAPSAPLLERNFPDLQIFDSDDDDGRRLAPHYFRRDFRQLGAVRTVLANQDLHPDWMLDVCLCFAPIYFKECEPLRGIEKTLRNVTELDFRGDAAGIPDGWDDLRSAARERFAGVQMIELNAKSRVQARPPLREVAQIAQRWLRGEATGDRRDRPVFATRALPRKRVAAAE